MADIIAVQTDGVPRTMRTRYRDMLDGTHAQVVALSAGAGGQVDISDRIDRLVGRSTNYDVLSHGTLAALNETVEIDASGLSTMGVSITGVWVGTIAIQGNIGDGVWHFLPMVDALTGTAIVAATANGVWQIGVGGFLRIRVLMFAYTNGTATIFIEGTSATAGVFLSKSLPLGINTIGAVRTLSSYDGTNWVEGRLDASTYARETIAHAHHEIHAGLYYHAHYNQFVSDTNDRSIITFRTANTTSWVHMFARGACTAFANWYVWGAPTVTDNTGAPLAIFNRNRNSANTSGVWDTSQNPDVQGQATYFTEATMGNVTAGTALEDQFIGYGSGPRASGGESRSEEELILIPNTLYAFEIKSLTDDDNYHDIELNWYEHTALAA